LLQKAEFYGFVFVLHEISEGDQVEAKMESSWKKNQYFCLLKYKIQIIYNYSRKKRLSIFIEEVVIVYSINIDNKLLTYFTI
jgi:hypothetical protein